MRGSRRGMEAAGRYTVIVVPDGVARVRRFRLRRATLRRGGFVAVLAAVLLLAGLADWVRLRLQAVDVASLRAETAAQREEVARFGAELSEIEQKLTRLHEFERKVRVIANLPKASAEHTHGDRDRPGVGGDDEEGMREAPPPGLPPLTPGASGGDSLAPELGAGWKPPPEPPFELASVGHLRGRARALREAALVQEASLEGLVRELDGRTRQLAATPSIWPAEGWITSRYGFRISPFTGRRQFHAGVDIAAHFGTEVMAPARGRVVSVGRKGALGRTVTIEHGWGIRTQYGHLASATVLVGQEVERGEPIGTVGSSGRSTGPHLHYAVAMHGKSVNPLDYVFE